MRIEKLRAWERSRPETTPKGIPTWGRGGRLITDNYTEERFESLRQSCIQQLESRLDLLRRRERIRRYELPVPGYCLEQKLGELLSLVLRRRAEYSRIAYFLTETFTDEQRRIIYALLEQIVEQVPWRGINFSYDPPDPE